MIAILSKRSFSISYDERFESDRDAGFTSTRRSLVEPANPRQAGCEPAYELQAELGLTKWAEVAVFRGFQPDDWIFGTEIGLLTKGEPFLLSAGFVNWWPHLDVNPQPVSSKPAITPSITRSSSEPFMPDTKMKQSLATPMTSMRDGECSSIGKAVLKPRRRIGFTCNVTRDFQFNPAIYFSNNNLSRVMGYIVFTYTFHLWGNRNENRSTSAKDVGHVAGAK